MNAVDLMTAESYGNNPELVLILAHGAGAPADSDFMETLAQALEQNGIAVVRFEFPYMQKRRADGRKRPPDRQPKLLECFAEVVQRVRQEVPESSRILVGGKSMGGRMASVLASDGPDVDGVVAFGYPFHPPGRLDKWRTDHFRDLKCPMLVVQGSRDPFGKAEEVSGLSGEWPGVRLHWLDGGNHDFQPLARQQASQADLIAEAAREAARFAQAVVRDQALSAEV